MDIAATRMRSHWRLIRPAGAVVAVTVLVGVATACSSGSSGPGVAGGGSSSRSASSAPSGSPSNDQLAFARCMRAHGVRDYPDSGALLGSSPDLDPSNPTYQAARRACQSLLPSHPAQQQAQNYANGLKFSECMRQHGITNFPDPDPHGGPNGHGGINLNHSGIDPNSPQYQAAQQACRHYLGDTGKGR